MRLMALLTFIFIWSVQVHSMEGVREPFECLPEARPFNGIRIKGDAAEQCRGDFERFRATQKEQRDKVDEYKAVESYAGEVIEASSAAACHDVLQGIREWISKPSNNSTTACTAGMMGGDRVLSINFETLAEVLSMRSKKPVMAQELSEQIANKKEQAKKYSLLRIFAQKVLNLSQYELDSLNSWLSGADRAMGYASPGISASLKCDVSLVCKLLEARAGRDITGEFRDFSESYSEKEERIRLKEDFDRYTNSVAGMGTEYVQEEIFENGMLTTKQAFSREYDISLPLMAARNNFLANLSAGAGGSGNARYRIYDCFVVSAQYSGVEVCHAGLANHSKISIEAGVIYQDGEILNSGDTVWALNAHKELRIFPQKKSATLGGAHHSYLFQEDSIGVPTACAGHMEVRNEKISKIDRSSGHYAPIELQLILAISYFHKIGIIADDVVLNGSAYSTGYSTLAEALSIANMIELA